jgi:hypothetical protein
LVAPHVGSTLVQTWYILILIPDHVPRIVGKDCQCLSIATIYSWSDYYEAMISLTLYVNVPKDMTEAWMADVLMSSLVFSAATMKTGMNPNKVDIFHDVTCDALQFRGQSCTIGYCNFTEGTVRTSRGH